MTVASDSAAPTILYILHVGSDPEGSTFEQAYRNVVSRLTGVARINKRVFILGDNKLSLPFTEADYVLFLVDGRLNQDVAVVWQTLVTARRKGVFKDICICVNDERYIERSSDIGPLPLGDEGHIRFFRYSHLDQLKRLSETLYTTWGRQLLAEAEPIPKQLGQAYMFGGPDHSSIKLLDPTESGIIDSEDQREGYSDIRQKAEELVSETVNSNRLNSLAGYASRLLLSMGSSLNVIRVRSFWAQMNGLRRRLEADDLLKAHDDPETPPLPAVVAYQLRDLVDALNVFAAHEPKLIELDELRADPSERSSPSSMMDAAGQLVNHTSSNPNVLSLTASDSLAEILNQASVRTGPSSERAKQFFVRSARNLAIEIIRRAKLEVSNLAKGAKEGAYRMAGAVGGAYVFAMVVKANEATIRTLIGSLGGSQTLNHIVDLVVHSLK